MKPSMAFVAFFNVFVQWPAFANYHEISGVLNTTLLDVTLLLSALPLITFAISGFTFQATARSVFQNLPSFTTPRNAVWVWLAGGCVVCASVYFSYVRLSATGLYSILAGNDDLSNRVAREESLKLLPMLPRYAFTFGSVVFANMLAVLAGYRIYQLFRNAQLVRRWYAVLFHMMLIIIAMLFSAISGARQPAAVTLLFIVSFLVLRARLRIAVIPLAVGLLLILSVPTVLQYLRSDTKEVGAALTTISERMFSIRVMAGVHTIAYTEQFGQFGVAAIPRLATFLGVPVRNAANEVANFMYPGSAIDTGLANCSFVLSYFAYFGPIALPLCVLLVLSLDGLLEIVHRCVAPTVQCLAVVGILVPILDLTSMDFTILFISKGVIPWLITCIIIDRCSRQLDFGNRIILMSTNSKAPLPEHLRNVQRLDLGQ